MAKHSINYGNTQEDTEENTPSSNISQRQGGMPPREASDQLKFTKVLQKPQECEDEERKEDALDQVQCKQISILCVYWCSNMCQNEIKS